MMILIKNSSLPFLELGSTTIEASMMIAKLSMVELSMMTIATTTIHTMSMRIMMSVREMVHSICGRRGCSTSS